MCPCKICEDLWSVAVAKLEADECAQASTWNHHQKCLYLRDTIRVCSEKLSQFWWVPLDSQSNLFRFSSLAVWPQLSNSRAPSQKETLSEELDPKSWKAGNS